jgi:hypothetical protein
MLFFYLKIYYYFINFIDENIILLNYDILFFDYFIKTFLIINLILK